MIRNKAEYYRLAELELAGNCPHVWHSVEDFLRESSDGFVSIRVTTVTSSSKFRAAVRRDKVASYIKEARLARGEYVISEIPMPGEILIQGELGWMNGSWVLYYSYAQTPMRQALREAGVHAMGEMGVWGTLCRYCTASDIDDLRGLFEMYTCGLQYPVIEFAALNKDIGIFPSRNTIVWEIRHY